MDPTIVSWVISLISGIVGGNVSGAIQKNNLGPIVNTVLGAIGGVAGGQGLEMAGLLQGLGMGGDIGASAIGGALLPLIAGFFKKKAA